MAKSDIGIRWTLGDVSDRGFEALRFSIWGARRLFGRQAEYAVCVNTIPLDVAKEKAGRLPAYVAWYDASGEIPGFLRECFDGGMAEGCGWKLAPLRMFPDRFEISLDNDCILWRLPAAMHEWLGADERGRCLMGEDVRACFGQFAPFCGSQARNAGIRGLPPDFDFEEALQEALRRLETVVGQRVVFASELDEQGLQTAALSRFRPVLAVALEDVTICSPFHPHMPYLGRCGAHFCGLNARHIAWKYFDRPADEWMSEHWARHRPALEQKVGLARGVEEVACVRS